MNVQVTPRRPMRVMHVSSVYPPRIVGGAEKVVAQLAEAQALRGVDVGAAYLSRLPEQARIRNAVDVYPQASRNLVWSEDVASRPRIARSLNKLFQIFDVRAGADFGRAIDRFGPDIVHTHSMIDLPPHVWTQARKAGARVVHTLHDYDLLCSRGTLFRNGMNCQRRHLACRMVGRWKAGFTGAVDGVAAVSRPVLDEHLDRGLFANLSEGRRTVIWNAVPSHGAPLACRRRDGPLTFGFLGRVVPEKGIGVLLAACRLIDGDSWRLRVAGRVGTDAEHLRGLARGRPVRFVGFVEPQGFLDEIDVLVVPSIWREPFGLTVVEAYARGVTVIGSDAGAIGSLVGSVDPERVVPAGDPEALAAAMRRLIAGGRAALPEPARFRPLLDAVRPERMIDAYAALYARVLTPEMSV